MEDVEVLAAAAPPPPPPPPDLDPSPVAKGKRSKRQRPLSLDFTIPNNDTIDFFSSASSSTEESTTTEELDTARCLILLSRGHFSTTKTTHNLPNHNPYRRSNKTVGGDGACVYTCKTCDRSFPSFQALGGHRTSHKKPRNEKKAGDDDDFSLSPSTPYRFRLGSLSLQMGSATSPRIHECSYCGAKFASGQALGGHMRKHRPGLIVRSPNVVEDVTKKAGNVGLSWDLNFPAPDDHRYSTVD